AVGKYLNCQVVRDWIPPRRRGRETGFKTPRSPFLRLSSPAPRERRGGFDRAEGSGVGLHLLSPPLLELLLPLQLEELRRPDAVAAIGEGQAQRRGDLGHGLRTEAEEAQARDLSF